jgi:hypothetical protein
MSGFKYVRWEDAEAGARGELIEVGGAAREWRFYRGSLLHVGAFAKAGIGRDLEVPRAAPE